MEAVLLSGSARPKGKTDTLCINAARALMDDGFEVRVFRPYNMRIAHCNNCGGCDGDGVCVIDDDMSEIYASVEVADIVVMCTPVHFSGISSILKQAIDRLQCFWVRPRIKKRKIFGLIACGGGPDPYFRNIISVSKAVANTLGAEWSGELTVPGTDKGITERQNDEAYGFGKKLSDAARS